MILSQNCIYVDGFICVCSNAEKGRVGGWAQALIDSNQEGLYSLEVKMAFLFYAAYLYHLAIHRYFLMHYYCNLKKINLFKPFWIESKTDFYQLPFPNHSGHACCKVFLIF